MAVAAVQRPAERGVGGGAERILGPALPARPPEDGGRRAVAAARGRNPHGSLFESFRPLRLRPSCVRPSGFVRVRGCAGFVLSRAEEARGSIRTNKAAWRPGASQAARPGKRQPSLLSTSLLFSRGNRQILPSPPGPDPAPIRLPSTQSPLDFFCTRCRYNASGVPPPCAVVCHCCAAVRRQRLRYRSAPRHFPPKRPAVRAAVWQDVLRGRARVMTWRTYYRACVRARVLCSRLWNARLADYCNRTGVAGVADGARRRPSGGGGGGAASRGERGTWSLMTLAPFAPTRERARANTHEHPPYKNEHALSELLALRYALS